MKIILELETVINNPVSEEEKKTAVRIIEKYFKFNVDIINHKPTYYRNLGNIWGKPDCIVELKNIKIE